MIGNIFSVILIFALFITCIILSILLSVTKKKYKKEFRRATLYMKWYNIHKEMLENLRKHNNLDADDE